MKWCTPCNRTEWSTALWMDKDPFPRVTGAGDCSLAVLCVLAAGPWPYPVGRGIELEAVAVCLFSLPIVGECGRCARLSCGGTNPPTRGLAALRFVCVCLCVRAGVGGGAPRCSFRILLCPALRMGALLCSPRTCLMYCHFFLFPHVEHRHTLGRKANKRETLL
ncbi:trans-sialidase [Trypanosoma cruzi cruzi]|nr:trans-sialidase [Trypanosoma cruzi cruzi]